MSTRIQIGDNNPQLHPELFQTISPDQVRPGDIFQGERNPSKWYRTDGHADNVDSWRTYYRRKDGTLSAGTATANAPLADSDTIVLGYIGPFVVTVSREGLSKAVETIDAA